MRQNTLLEGCADVEPVSADAQIDEDEAHDRAWWSFHPSDEEDVGEKMRSAPTFVMISPGIELVRRMLCEGRSSVVR